MFKKQKKLIDQVLESKELSARDDARQNSSPCFMSEVKLHGNHFLWLHASCFFFW